MLYDDMKVAFKNAMRTKDTVAKEIYSYVISQLDAKAKDNDIELTDDDVIQVVKKEIKTRKESAAMYLQAGKSQEASEEEAKIALLEQYLPEMMDREAIEVLVRQLIQDLGIVDLHKERGRLIGAIMKDYKAVIDGGMMNEVINSIAE